MVFGGDTEIEAWKEYIGLEENRYKYFTNDIKFLKAPHHGSPTSFYKDMWRKWGKDYCVVVTPLSKNNLPNKNVLMDISKISPKIFVLKETKNIKVNNKSILNIFEDVSTDITDSIEETHHFCFTIYQNGNTNTEWIKSN